MYRNYDENEKRIIESFKRFAEPKCYYCGKDLSGKKKSNRTVDHKVPLSRGGDTTYENLAISCFDCNNEKDNRTEEEYLEFRELQKEMKNLEKIIYAENQKSISLNNKKQEIEDEITSINFQLKSLYRKKNKLMMIQDKEKNKISRLQSYYRDSTSIYIDEINEGLDIVSAFFSKGVDIKGYSY